MAVDADQGRRAPDPDVVTTPAERAVREERQRRLEAVTRIALRPIASPLALGFLALAGGTFTLAGLQLGWVDEQRQVGLILLAFTVPLQLLAAIFGFLARDTVAATGMGLLSGIWLAIALVLVSTPPESTSDALGLFLLVAGVAMLLPAIGAAMSKVAAALVLGTAGVRFFLGGVHQLSAVEGWEDAAGLVGLLLTALAVYAAFAIELEDVQGREVLPIGRRGVGVVAVNGSLFDQLRRIDAEPGIKRPL